jgi:AmmeMemoRadiSam system protein A
MLDKPAEAELIKYATSGELTGDFSSSVSYLSAAFSGKWQNCPPIKPQRSNVELTEEDKKQLLTLARESIIYALQKRRVPEASELGITISDAMRDPRAAFVTLKKNSQLRGCIGDIFPQRPLYKSVLYNAIYAGFRDKRFIPVTKDELDDIVIEISALTPPQPVASYHKIRIGTDGVVLNKDGQSAVFLPQVAPEQGWDINQMLTQLSLKAKLPGDAWKEGANFLVFQAVVFGEEE